MVNKAESIELMPAGPFRNVNVTKHGLWRRELEAKVMSRNLKGRVELPGAGEAQSMKFTDNVASIACCNYAVRQPQR
jgi:hypothetical protein